MAEPFLSEIRMFSFAFPPRGWALCNAQLLPINQNQALFSLLGTTYGGDGRVNFALPELRGRVPISVGGSHTLGERAGTEAHTLSIAELPAHTHVMSASTTPGTSAVPTNNFLGSATMFGPPNALVENQVSSAIGGSQAHLNMQPFLTISYCIALQGIFPSQT